MKQTQEFFGDIFDLIKQNRREVERGSILEPWDHPSYSDYMRRKRKKQFKDYHNSVATLKEQYEM